MKLKGKIALVTGASRGLGRAIALALGRAGADVVVTDLLVEGNDNDPQKPAEYSLLAGPMGAFAQPSYGASKAGLIGLTKSLALEGAKH